MAKQTESPFERLSDEEKRATVDIGVMLVALGVRVPSAGKQLYDFVCTEFLRSYKLPNAAKYALREVATELMEGDWQFTVIKKGGKLITAFKNLEKTTGNGQDIVQ